jgi:hypothetical protein
MSAEIDFEKIEVGYFVSGIFLDDKLFCALEDFTKEIRNEYERRSRKPSLHRRGNLPKDANDLEILLIFFESIRNKDADIRAYPPDLYEAKKLQQRRTISGSFIIDFFHKDGLWIFLEAKQLAK